MRSQIRARSSRHRALIALGFLLVALILAVFAGWNPLVHYFGGYRVHWRGWIAIVAGILALAGLLTFVRRSRPGTRVTPATGYGWQPAIPPSATARTEAPPAPPRDWFAITAATLPGLAAVAALIFTALTVQATKGQLQVTQQQLTITEVGQITDRYNAAITNLGSPSIDIRLGGIYALQHVMQDYPPYQPTIVAVLCAFARDQSASDAKLADASAPSLPQDVHAALTVVGTRNPADDDRAAVIDLDHAQLTAAQLQSLRLTSVNPTGVDLDGVVLADADLTSANLAAANLSGANLSGANLMSTVLAGANLTGANLTAAQTVSTDLANANLSHADLAGTVLAGVNLTNASFSAADLAGAVLAGEILPDVSFATANLTGADLSGAAFTNGYLVAANLSQSLLVNTSLIGADLTGADLSDADLRYAHLAGATLSYVNLADADGYAANLAGANLASADLKGANLSGYAADLAGANLTGADLAGANLMDANLAGADLRAATFTGANLTGANWPHGLAAPAGWQRKPASDRLEQATLPPPGART